MGNGVHPLNFFHGIRCSYYQWFKNYGEEHQINRYGEIVAACDFLIGHLYCFQPQAHTIPDILLIEGILCKRSQKLEVVANLKMT